MPGPASDEVVVWYEGSGTADRRWLQGDERGSIVALSDASGAAIALNRYDEYGIPAATNLGRFGYTGQAFFAEAGLSYYKARWYSPTMGRFMQTDPIGYGDGLNWYNYVGSDPINKVDPTGMMYIIAKCTTTYRFSETFVEGGEPAILSSTSCDYSGGSGWGTLNERPIRGRGESGGRSGSGLLGTVANALEGLFCNVAFGIDIGGKVVLDGKLGGGSLKLSYDATSGNIIAGLQGSRGVSGTALDLKILSFDFGNEARHQSHSSTRISHSEVSLLGTLRHGRIVGSGGLKAGFDFSTSDDFSAVGRHSVGKLPGC